MVLTILTDERVVALTAYLITGLFMLISVGGGYFVKQVLWELKQNRLALANFTAATTVNINAVEKTQAIHEQKIDQVSNEQDDQKKKLDDHAVKIAVHAGKISALERRSRP